MKAPKYLWTIGYAGRTPSELIALLRSAGVTRVVDVRELPLSRRKGFSKTPLREALAAVGIDYVHVRAAGNPYRDLRQDPVMCLGKYSKHLDSVPEVIGTLSALAAEQRSALLCFESRADECHRSILANRMVKQIPSCELHHLGC